MTETTAEKYEKNRSGKLEFGAAEASRPFHGRGSRQIYGCQRKVASLSTPDRGEAGEAGENEKSQARELRKSSKGEAVFSFFLRS